ncbi:MAG: DUF4445 domain-containing protein, partial [Ruminococcus sp.]|nr:DUF4445 domain-containing protein [Candidatus Apopatosoma intestinale]
FIQKDKIEKITVQQGENVLSALRSHGLFVYSPCGGRGVCGKCLVQAAGTLSELSETEKRYIPGEECARGIRLACEALILGDCEIRPVSDGMDVLTDGSDGFADLRYAGEEQSRLGVAVDIGTTTVAVYLYELTTGVLLGTRGFANPQAGFGADVISRMMAIMTDDGALAAQQSSLLAAVSEAIRSFGIETDRIENAVFCGNTVMEHIAAGVSPVPMATAPFTAPTLFGYGVPAKQIGWGAAPGALIWFAPCFASYVGGDIACGILAADLDRTKKTCLFLDIGTNGEMALVCDGRIFLCATAAGPAFEGGNLSCGMPGTDGAISRVWADGNTVRYQTVGNAPARGICGSGILDAVSVMLDLGLLDETGRIEEPFVIGDSGIVVTGADIREIQLAKAAVCAGIRTLLDTAGLTCEDVETVVLAGGFGSALRPESALRIGLLPGELRAPVVSLGNTAGKGASRVLLENGTEERMLSLCRVASYIELSGNAFFSDVYPDEMMFETSE